MRLASVSNTHVDYPESILFQYDSSGNLLNDDKGRHYTYNLLGQMEAVSDSERNKLSDYSYSGTGQVVSRTQDDFLIHLYYQGEKLVNEFSEGTHTSYHNTNSAVTGRTVLSDKMSQHQFLLRNGQNSTVTTKTEKQSGGARTTEHRSYSPYGEG